MRDGGGVEEPEDLLRDRVESEVGGNLLRTVQLAYSFPTCRLQRSSGSKSTQIFPFLRYMDMIPIPIMLLGQPTSCKRGYAMWNRYS
jgi:hypothetical protein